MNSNIRTGTRVTDSIAAPAIANVLVNASGAKSRPSWDEVGIHPEQAHGDDGNEHANR